MRVPDLGRFKDGAKLLNNSNSTGNETANGPIDRALNLTQALSNRTVDVVNATTESSTRTENSATTADTTIAESTRRAKRSRRPDDVVGMQRKPARSTKAHKKVLSLDEKRGACPKGKAFYKCANGFTGCCSIDPCSDSGRCPDNQNGGGGQPTKTRSTKGQQSTTSPKSEASSTASSSPTTTSDASPPTQSSSGNSPPACPAANGKIYKDGSGITYRIHCNADNTFTTSGTITIDSGGYGGCFSACSKTSTCAGFVFTGSDSGTCALKGQLPGKKYVVKENSNIVSCAKLNPKASTGGSGGGKKPSIGVLAGAIIGALFFLALLVSVILWLIKRKKKKAVERQTIVLNNIQTPVETAPLHAGGHLRQVSTSHDVFGPYGGYHRGFSDEAIERFEPGSSNQVGCIYNSTRPATSYWRPDSNHIPIMLDRSPTGEHSYPSPGSRSPRFHEHLRDFDDNRSESVYSQRYDATVTSDSPTLGRSRAASSAIIAGNPFRDQNLSSRARYDLQHPPQESSTARRSPEPSYKPSGVSSFDFFHGKV